MIGMKNMLEVLFLESHNLREEYIISGLRGCNCHLTLYSGTENKEELEQILKDKIYHFVFSIEFSPLAAHACEECGTKYVSWVYDHSAFLGKLECISSYNNYIFLHDYSLYLEFINRGFQTIYCFPLAEIDSIELYMQYINFMFSVIFKEKELEIFDTILQLERLRKKDKGPSWIIRAANLTQNREDITDDSVNTMYRLMKEEKELFILMHRQLTDYLNNLLKQKYANIGKEIFVWNKRGFSRELGATFWQFNCLVNIYNIFVEEMQATPDKKIPIFPSYESLDEMCNDYFKTIFWLRRMEYDIEESEGTMMSETAIKYILNIEMIYDKEKVRRKLREKGRLYSDEQ